MQTEKQILANLKTLNANTALILVKQGLEPATSLLNCNAKCSTSKAVNLLHVNTLGSVARPGEPLIEIVPLEDTLLIEAYVRPKDIAFLYPGQLARKS